MKYFLLPLVVTTLTNARYYNSLCEVNSTTINISRAKNADGTNVLVLNNDADASNREDFVQIIDVTLCIEKDPDGTACSSGAVLGVCHQQYIDYQLVVSTEGEEYVMQNFSIPCGCMCKLVD